MKFRLAFRNLLGAGLRTWLNIAALSLCFALILILQGMYNGLFGKIEHDMIETEVAGGQYWVENYDPYNPIRLDSYYRDYNLFQPYVESGDAVPVLYRSAVMYPNGGSMNVILKGIDRSQTLLSMPTEKLSVSNHFVIPAYIGKIMAGQSNLKIGDPVTVRFRTQKGIHDAIEVKIVHIMDTPIQSVDVSQIWIDLETLQDLTGLENCATIITVSEKFEKDYPEWEYQGMDIMFADLNSWKVQEMGGAYMMMAILLGMAVLAVFDTQLLAIFRRKKEIGTLVSLGMTPASVVHLFSVEGLIYGVISVAAGSLYGIPLLLYFQSAGINMGEVSEGIGLDMSNVIYPEFSIQILLISVFVILTVVYLVSLLAAKRISAMNIPRILKSR